METMMANGQSMVCLSDWALSVDTKMDASKQTFGCLHFGTQGPLKCSTPTLNFLLTALSWHQPVTTARKAGTLIIAFYEKLCKNFERKVLIWLVWPRAREWVFFKSSPFDSAVFINQCPIKQRKS